MFEVNEEYTINGVRYKCMSLDETGNATLLKVVHPATNKDEYKFQKLKISQKQE